MRWHVVLLPGDGVGPEVVEAASGVLVAAAARAGLTITTETLLVGGAAIEAYGTPLREEDLERCRTADAVLLGAVGGPRWDHLGIETRPERALLRLRSALDLGINLRPVTRIPAGSDRSPVKDEVARGTDIAFVRELTGGVYFGTPSYYQRTPGEGHAVDTCSYSERQVRAAVEFAFELAGTRRGRVTSVDKANVLNTSRLWRDVARAVGAEHPEIELEHALVDSFAMALIQDPRRHDVVVTENLFGDILTDLAGVLTGTLGTLPSASLTAAGGSSRFGLYEPIHGSAPTIAGENIANPVGTILSVALMFELSFARPDVAALVRDAVRETIETGTVTADLVSPGGTATGTREFAVAVVDRIDGEGGARGHRDLRHHVA